MNICKLIDATLCVVVQHIITVLYNYIRQEKKPYLIR